MNRKKALELMTLKDQHEYGKLSNEAIALKLAYSYNIECVTGEIEEGKK